MHTACGCAGEASEILCGSRNSTSPFRFTPGSGIPPWCLSQTSPAFPGALQCFPALPGAPSGVPWPSGAPSGLPWDPSPPKPSPGTRPPAREPSPGTPPPPGPLGILPPGRPPWAPPPGRLGGTTGGLRPDYDTTRLEIEAKTNAKAKKPPLTRRTGRRILKPQVFFQWIRLTRKEIHPFCFYNYSMVLMQS